MARKKPKFYYCKTFRQNIYYFLGWDWNEYRAYLLKHFAYETQTVEEPDGHCTTLENPPYHIICIWTGKRDKLRAALMHECIHAAVICLAKRGVDVRTNDGETLAYLAESFFREALT